MKDNVDINETSPDASQSQTPDVAPKETASGGRIAVARSASFLARALGRIFNGVVALHEAIAIGVLRRSDILEAVSQSYRAAPSFYDPERYSLRIEEEILPLLEAAAPGRRLLDLYAGQGREAEIFARAGYDVLGVEGIADVAARAEARARREDFSAQFIAADIETWEPPSRDWDVVYTSLWMYSCLPDRDARLAWLKKLAGFASEAGVLVVSTMPRSGGHAAQWRHRIAQFIARVTLNPRHSELGDRFDRGLFWRDFSHEEALDELHAAALTVVATHDHRGDHTPPCTFYLLRVQAGAT
ncbi:MAG: methyltransferase domain-containing protein [Pseudomonadota bacterium]